MSVLYAPGSCGKECSLKNYKCKTKEVNQACCGRSGNCNSKSSVPRTCTIGCAMVFPPYFDKCKAIIMKSIKATKKSSKAIAAEVGQYKNFVDKCGKQNAGEYSTRTTQSLSPSSSPFSQRYSPCSTNGHPRPGQLM